MVRAYGVSFHSLFSNTVVLLYTSHDYNVMDDLIATLKRQPPLPRYSGMLHLGVADGSLDY